jgi:type I restriction enzyme S subunit
LAQISDSYSGGTPSVGRKEYYGGQIPFIRSAEINASKTELSLTKKGLESSSAAMVNAGEILYALYGATSGEVGISRIKGAINQAVLAILPHKGYDPNFIASWLRKSKETIVKRYLQGGQGNLSGAIVKGLEIKCPEESEQKRIGLIFCCLDAVIVLHQREC